VEKKIGEGEKKPATINENHARELMELHTVSPKAGYTQEDVMDLAKIMTGWRPKWTKKSDQGTDIRFMSDRHEPGKKYVFGKEYKKGKDYYEIDNVPTTIIYFDEVRRGKTKEKVGILN
jgi:uncharacterized protein (DUF1800 family)